MTETVEAAAPARTRKAKPSIEERARIAICPECGGKVARRSNLGPVPTFCSKTCKRVRGNRRLVRGSNVIELLQAWRIERGTGPIASAAFAQICQIVDLYNAEDLEAGRPRADIMAAKMLSNGVIYLDRQRRRVAVPATAD